MANGGWYGTPEEWSRIEAPLIDVDPKIDAFARSFRLTVTKNHKDWPERSIQWGGEPRCLIQIYLLNSEALKWNLWICCSIDKELKRYWRREFLIENQSICEFENQLLALLFDGRKRLIEWSEHPETLELATSLISP
jgi:hypothetical protein